MIPQTWNEFLEFIGDVIDKELDQPLISQFIKIPNTRMTSFQIISYFSADFQKYKTIIGIRAKIKRKCKWGCKEKYFLIWCITKITEKLQIKFHELVMPFLLFIIVQYQWKVFEKLSSILNLSEELLLTKWLSLLNYKLKEQPWKKEEDDLLIKLRQYQFLLNWIKIAIEFIKTSQTVRYPKQIRERFNNVINPDINKQSLYRFRNEFRQDEILIIIRKALSTNKNWARISKSLPGRTDNQIKNLYNSIIRKILNEKEKPDDKVDELQILNLIIQHNNYDPIFISSILEETKRKQICVKTESTSDNSQTSEMGVNNLPFQLVYPVFYNQPFNYQNIYFSYPQFYLLPHQQSLRNPMFNQT
ncbi:unnamed protein product (macronuclear) [Paramecium tetraurelia]|uniref:Myb-like domain-containing protein n=1 Tax=Paramecium tetraurelia TaxID=5888 RepID=A0DAG6_PARTE|nr:uncharacterized protein GSPATT00014940001 [Paramecium tetraurelia]CAK80033.1 unnamed protein product [Paramecium tetraurelia]|eukprot:XP_001447430.1 hypothetical protein (macronuclear) [Paramecium tetraurelia strain d4-2]